MKQDAVTAAPDKSVQKYSENSGIKERKHSLQQTMCFILHRYIMQ